MLSSLCLSLSVLLSITTSTQPDSPTCTTAVDCRQAANEALGREDYERFHSLAWRVVQTSKGNDRDAMLLLARAQSLSGRAQDALVMLRRLADMGTAVVEAETSDEFRRVRALPSWPELLDRIRAVAGAKDAAPAVKLEAAAPPKPTEAATKNSASVTKPPAAAMSPADPAAKKEPATPVSPGDGTFSLPSAALRNPVAMAYDSASNRFVLADHETETLKVLSRMSSHVEDLVRRRWAGSFRTTALAIDAQRGDLWVSGADADAAGGARSVLHRMQLISGRLLYSIEMPSDLGSVTLTDIVISGNRIVALDSSGLRLVALNTGAKTPQVQAELNGLESPTSVAPGNDGGVYVSHENGIARIAAGSRRPTFLKASNDVDLTGFRWIRHHDGSLIGIQQRGGESQTLVRVRLDKSGASARAIEVLDKRRTTTAVLAGDALYYLTEEPDGSGQMLRRLELR
jgi:hypothetical protein